MNSISKLCPWEIRKALAQNLRDASVSSVDLSTVRSQWKGVCQEAILKKTRRKWQIKQELDWKSVMEWKGQKKGTAMSVYSRV